MSISVFVNTIYKNIGCERYCRMYMNTDMHFLYTVCSISCLSSTLSDLCLYELFSHQCLTFLHFFFIFSSLFYLCECTRRASRRSGNVTKNLNPGLLGVVSIIPRCQAESVHPLQSAVYSKWSLQPLPQFLLSKQALISKFISQ